MLKYCVYISGDQLKLLFKEKSELHCSRSWLQEISNLEEHPICRTYIMFKEKLSVETYIQCIFLKKIPECYYSFSGQLHRLGI